MKKLIFITLLIAILFPACGTMRVAGISSLRIGMPQREVNRLMGNPIRKLSINNTIDGVEEAYEYHTYQNEAYAVSFLNGRLSAYDFMYDITPPVNVTPGRPIPPRPTYPNYPNRPQPGRPSQPSRPQPGRPDSNRPTIRPVDNTRPTNGSSGSNTSTTRPVEKKDTDREEPNTKK